MSQKLTGSRVRSIFGLICLLVLISVSCSPEILGLIKNDNVKHDLISSEEFTDDVSQFQIVIAVTDIAIGENRFAFAIIGKTGPLILKEVHISLSPITGTADGYNFDSTALFQAWPLGNSGVYVGKVNFGIPGEWIIQVEDISPNPEFLGSAKFFVNKVSSTPAVGVKPKPLDNLTNADVKDINQITSALNPDPDLYKISVSEAINSGIPTIITFASPSFCRTSTCGPQVEIISSLNRQFGDRLNIIHIEVYERSEIDDDGNYELKISSLLETWGLNSEPFTFMLDKKGTIAAKFEGFVTESELTEHIRELLDI